MYGVVPVIPLPPIFGYDQPEQHHDTMTMDPIDVNVTITQVAAPDFPFLDASALPVPEYVGSWDDYVGQQPVKDELEVYIDEAIVTCGPLPHILLASGIPGVGKTTLARLIAKELRSQLITLSPPFSPTALHTALLSLEDNGILFIDEIHKMADGGPRMAENLLHALEDGVLYLETGIVKLADITIIGATTDADKLPETIIDRFVIKPFFQGYTLPELVRITKNFCNFYDITLLPETMVAIAKACRGVPRVARELVVGARALAVTQVDPVTPAQLLHFKQVEPDGMTRQHMAYLKALYSLFRRTTKDGEVEFVAGEAALMSLLRENKPGLARLERFLIERGLIDRTPRGRSLTERGQIAAIGYLRDGK